MIVNARTRFAPSPTGLLHLGTAFSALYAYDKVADVGGQFVLRIEDIDSGRCKPEYEEAILQDLDWLGLQWEEPVVRQSEHRETYRETLRILETLGVTYPCFCTRKEIQEEAARSLHAPHGPEGILYPGTCRSLSPEQIEQRLATGDRPVVRLDLARARTLIGGEIYFEEIGRGPEGKTGTILCAPELLGDIVLARKDIGVSYHLCVVADDARQQINLVARGEDLFHATSIQRLLQELLGLPAPTYDHHKLILAANGRRLSKRDEDQSIRSLREAGHSARDIRQQLGFHW